MSRGHTIDVDARPWGAFAVLAEGTAQPAPMCAVKVLWVLGGQTLSLQKHAWRAERWVPLDHGLVAEIDGQVEEMEPGRAYDVPQGAVHRLSNRGAAPARVVEVMFGQYREDDIERLADEYGRC